MTVGSGPALFDVAPGTGVVYDYKTDPTNPLITFVSWNAFTDVSLPHIAAGLASTVFVDPSGTTLTQTSPSATPNLRREKLTIGVVQHTDNATITGIANNPILAFGKENTNQDALVETGEQNISGNAYSAQGVNTKLARTAGVVYSIGANSGTDLNNPNFLNVAADTDITVYLRSFRDGVGGFTTSIITSLDPDVYDDNSGTPATISPNRFSIKEIRLVGEIGLTVVTLGQDTYATLSDALLALPLTIEVNPNIRAVPVRARVIAKVGNTDFTDVSEVEIRCEPENGFSGT